MKKLLKRLVKDEQGLELSEYAVMLGLIVAALVTIVTTLGTTILNLFNDLVINLGGTP